jgi:hypothetical protein
MIGSRCTGKDDFNDDFPGDTKIEMIEKLGKTGKDASAALPVLATFLNDKSEKVRVAAKQAINTARQG